MDSVVGILTCSNVLVTFRPELETKLKAYNDYFAANAKQQITEKYVSKLFFVIPTWCSVLSEHHLTINGKKIED